MLNVGKLNLKEGAAPYKVPYRNSLLEVVHPDTRLGILEVSTDQDDRRVMMNLLGREYKGLKLDFATGSRKHGSFIATDSAIAKRYWRTPEEAICYGSNLLTTCREFPQQQALIVKVVEDGQAGTADCHAKIKPALMPLFGTPDHAIQFRMIAGPYLAKGTAAPGRPDQIADLVIPVSCFKSHQKPPHGVWLWQTTWGNVFYSEKRQAKVGYQFLQWFSFDAIMADCKPHIDAEIARLEAASKSPRAAAELLGLDNMDDVDYNLIQVIKADVHDQLERHPWIVNGLARLLRQKWMHLATGAGLFATSLMAMPDESLPDNVVCSPDLTQGPVIAFRYPIRNWADIRLWEVDFTRHQDVPSAVWMNSKTAAQCGGDFDGDYFNLLPYSRFPTMAAEVAEWHDTRTPPSIPKAVARNASHWSDLPRVAMDSITCPLGWVTNLITKANAAGQLDLCNRLAAESQIAVDGLKFAVQNDWRLLRTAQESLPKLDWMEDLKDNLTFIAHSFRSTSQDTIGRLIQYTAQHWTPPAILARPLEEFAHLFPKTIHYKATMKTLHQRYGKLIADYMEDSDQDSLQEVFAALSEWVSKLKDPTAAACALWHEVHKHRRYDTISSGSLVFHAFPAQIADRLQSAPAAPEVISVVGLQYHEWAERLAGLSGVTEVITVLETVLQNRVRSLVRVAGLTLGLVSSETPCAPGFYLRRLLWNESGVVYASTP